MPTIRLSEETKHRIQNAAVAGMTYDEKLGSILDQIEANE